MSDVHLTEDEQVAALRNWWKENGKAVLFGVIIGVAVVASVIYWRDYKHEHAETASLTYSEFAEAVQNNKDEIIKSSLQKLQNDYKATPYAALAALTMAKRNIDAGNYPEAETNLDWAVKNAVHDAIAHVARIRLARVLIQQSKIDVALALIEPMHEPAFDVDYAELRGDAYKIQGKKEQAREAYTQALGNAELQGQRRQFLEMKRDDLLTTDMATSNTEAVPVNAAEKK